MRTKVIGCLSLFLICSIVLATDTKLFGQWQPVPSTSSTLKMKLVRGNSPGKNFLSTPGSYVQVAFIGQEDTIQRVGVKTTKKYLHIFAARTVFNAKASENSWWIAQPGTSITLQGEFNKLKSNSAYIYSKVDISNLPPSWGQPNYLPPDNYPPSYRPPQPGYQPGYYVNMVIPTGLVIVGYSEPPKSPGWDRRPPAPKVPIYGKNLNGSFFTVTARSVNTNFSFTAILDPRN